MKPISDIRLYRNNIPNIDGNPHPSEFASKQLNIIVTRIVMKLRENGFSLGDYDHLYINFTTCLTSGAIEPAKRSVDAYHKWYRYFDVGVTDECYRNLEGENCTEFVIEQIKNVLNAHFHTETNCSVEPCIEEAITKGEDMLMLYKTKQTSKRKAEIYLQMLDNGMYCPNLFVYDQDGVELLHKKLPCTSDLMSLGEIQLSSKKVVVKPRKNSLAAQLEPVEFELKKDDLVSLIGTPRDACYLPLTVQMVASWKIPELQEVLISYLDGSDITAKSVGLPADAEGYYPSLNFIKRQIKFSAIAGLKYYPCDKVKKLLTECSADADKDIAQAAKKVAKYW